MRCRNPVPLTDQLTPAILPPLQASEPPPAPEVPAPDHTFKSVYIRHADLEKWGYTANCPRCSEMRLRQSARGVHHTLYCRPRLELAMAEADDPGGS